MTCLHCRGEQHELGRLPMEVRPKVAKQTAHLVDSDSSINEWLWARIQGGEAPGSRNLTQRPSCLHSWRQRWLIRLGWQILRSTRMIKMINSKPVSSKHSTPRKAQPGMGHRRGWAPASPPFAGPHLSPAQGKRSQPLKKKSHGTTNLLLHRCLLHLNVARCRWLLRKVMLQVWMTSAMATTRTTLMQQI